MLTILTSHLILLISILFFLIHTAGFICAAHAIMTVRTSQGTIAWVFALITLPYIAVPAYLVLGRNKFGDYAEAHRLALLQIQGLAQHVYADIVKYETPQIPELAVLQKTAKVLSGFPFTSANEVALLINGEPIFNAMLEAIENAQDYILIQFFIVHDDEVGRRFQQALIKKAQQGVRVYFVYDDVGSHELPLSYVTEIRKYGCHMWPFRTNKRTWNRRFQINFRNHRKLVIADGKKAVIGGVNLGDEYLGKSKRFGPWRDTGIILQGPGVQCMQISFANDWYWATSEFITLNWQISPCQQTNQSVLVLSPGPGDEFSTAMLFFIELINQARTRLWIASPYFVPNGSVMNALELAALRGVDVRILLPDRVDHVLVYLCSFSYYHELQQAGIKVYRYKKGFMHQKVIVVDDLVAGVGSINLDNRSLNINFEMMAFVTELDFIKQVDQMLQQDFACSYKADLKDYVEKHVLFHLISRIARLFGPIL